MNWWNLISMVLMFLLTLGVGAIGYFLRRLIAEFDAVRANQAAVAERAKAAEETARSLARDMLRVQDQMSACRGRSDGAIDAIRRDLNERYVRVVDLTSFQARLVEMRSTLEPMLQRVVTDVAGILAALHATETRLQEGNSRFCTIEANLREQDQRIARMEGV